MSNIKVVIPEIVIYSHDFDKFYEVIKVEDVLFKCDIFLPSNDSDNDIIYTFEVYTNNEPSGKFVKVKVLSAVEYHKIKLVTAEPNVLPSTGGKSTIYIYLDIPFTTIENIPQQSGTLVYNGEELSPTWINYNEEEITINGDISAVNAGEYITIFKPNDGYKWKDGSSEQIEVPWYINKAEGSLSIEPDSISLTTNNDTGIIRVTSIGDGIISAVSSNTDIVSVTIIDDMITVNSPISNGNATVTVTVEEGTNHLASADKVCNIDVNIEGYISRTPRPEHLEYKGYEQYAKWGNFNEKELEIGGQISGIDAGMYIATFTPKPRYEWWDGTDEEKEVEWEILRAYIYAVPSQDGILVETGEVQSPKWLDYDPDKLDISGDTSAKFTGIYIVRFTPKKNYLWSNGSSGPKTVSWEIR